MVLRAPPTWSLYIEKTELCSQQVWIYNSTNLTDWEKVSSFGPIGSAYNNIWEVPDLVELDLRDPSGLLVGKSWVLFVSVNHGTPYGGSGVQYFIGDFDGRIFQVDESYLRSSPPQPQEIIANFDCSDFPDGWKVSGDAWGEGPTVGGVDGQEFVSGFTGRRLANSCEDRNYLQRLHWV
jgi:hypothetical protein